MTRPVEVAPLAIADIAATVEHYNILRPGWGDVFADEFEQVARRIGDHPQLYQRLSSIFHRAVLHRFPFIIVYRLSDHLIEVIGVFPAQANPARVTDRIKGLSHYSKLTFYCHGRA